MQKFGFLNWTTIFFVIMYITIAVLLLYVSYNFINQIDWGANITIFDNFNNLTY